MLHANAAEPTYLASLASFARTRDLVSILPSLLRERARREERKGGERERGGEREAGEGEEGGESKEEEEEEEEEEESLFRADAVN